MAHEIDIIFQLDERERFQNENANIKCKQKKEEKKNTKVLQSIDIKSSELDRDGQRPGAGALNEINYDCLMDVYWPLYFMKNG